MSTTTTTAVEDETVTFNMECNICFSSLRHATSRDCRIVALIPCGHCFHQRCLWQTDKQRITIMCPTCHPSKKRTIVRLDDSSAPLRDDNSEGWYDSNGSEASEDPSEESEEEHYSHEDALYGPVPINIQVPTKCMPVNSAADASAPPKEKMTHGKKRKAISQVQFQEMKSQVKRARQVASASQLVCHDFRLRHSKLCRRHERLKSRWWEKSQQLKEILQGMYYQDEGCCVRAQTHILQMTDLTQSESQKYHRKIVGWRDALQDLAQDFRTLYTTRSKRHHYLQELEKMQLEHDSYEEQLEALQRQIKANKDQYQNMLEKKRRVQQIAKLTTQHQGLEERIVTKDKKIQCLQQRVNQLKRTLNSKAFATTPCSSPPQVEPRSRRVANKRVTPEEKTASRNAPSNTPSWRPQLRRSQRIAYNQSSKESSLI